MKHLLKNQSELKQAQNKPIELRNYFMIEDVSTIEQSEENPVILKGYFKKWKSINGNREKYEKTAYDKFIQEYFVENKLNVPVDVNHGSGIESLIGKVVKMENNSVGIWAEIELSKHAIHYANIIGLIKDGILQGFSDHGWSTDYEYVYNTDGSFSHMLIREAQLLSISIVPTPAETKATFEFSNATKFSGFGEKKKEENKLKILK